MTGLHFFIKVEVAPGTSIDQAARDMCALADRLNCGVIDNHFNGVEVFAGPKSSPEDIALSYHTEQNRIQRMNKQQQDSPINAKPLIEVKTINEKIAEQIPRVTEVGSLSEAEYDAMRKAERLGFFPAYQCVLIRREDTQQLQRVPFLVEIMLDGPGIDAQEMRRKGMREMPQLFLS